MATDQSIWSVFLNGLPSDLALIPVNDRKVPIDPITGDPKKQFTTDPAFRFTPAELDQFNGKVKAVGSRLGAVSGGLAGVDFDGPKAEQVFQEKTGHSIADLPKTVANTSGLEGHYQLFFRFPKAAWKDLSNKDFWSDDPAVKDHWELRWNGHSVVTGVHPNWKDPRNKAGWGEGPGDGFYSYCDGCSPSEVPIADAPDWLVKFWLKECGVSGTGQTPTSDSCQSTLAEFGKRSLAWDIFRYKEIVQDWLFPVEQHQSYSDWFMVGSVGAYLSHMDGDPWLLFPVFDEWSSLNESVSEDGTPKYPGTKALKKKWRSFCRTEGKVQTFGSLLHYAIKHTGYRPSTTEQEFYAEHFDAEPPKKKATKQDDEPSRAELLEALMQELYRLNLEGHSWSELKAQRSFLFERGKVTKEEIQKGLIEKVAEDFGLHITDAGPKERTTECLLDPSPNDEELDPLVDGFLMKGADHIVYAPTGTGKTTFLLGLSYHACVGGTAFDSPNPVNQSDVGRTLWIASDGGPKARNMVHKYVSQLKAPAENLWRSRVDLWAANPKKKEAPWAFTPRGLHQLFNQLQKGQESGDPYNLVVIDTLKSVMDLADLDYGIGPMGSAIRLMQAAAERFNVAVVWSHHNKQGTDRSGGNASFIEVPYGKIRLMPHPHPEHGYLVRCDVEKYRSQSPRTFYQQRDEEKGLFKVVEADKVQVKTLLYEVWLVRDEGATTKELAATQSHVQPRTVGNQLTELKKQGLIKSVDRKWWPSKKGAKQLALEIPSVAGEVSDWLAEGGHTPQVRAA